MNSLNLLIEFFDAHDSRRNAEFLWALHENLTNKVIDQIHVFQIVPARLQFSSPKLNILSLSERATFADLFGYCNEQLDGQICLIANSDIVFNGSLQIVHQLDLDKRLVALSRWEMEFHGSSFQYRLFDNAASQDTWIFQSPVSFFKELSFYPGTPGCDNRIARIFNDNGYRVNNPAKRIVTSHFHFIRNTLVPAANRVPGPYLLVPTTDDLSGGPANIEIDGFDERGHPVIGQKRTVAEQGTSEPSIEILSSRLPPKGKSHFRSKSSDDFPARILFDHLPRCGGTTLTCFLEQHYPPELVFRTNGWNPQQSVQRFRTLAQADRHRLRLITGHETHHLITDVHPDTLIVTLLRDPVERIASHYRHVLFDESHYLHREVTERRMTLEQYALSGLSNELFNWYTMHFSGIPAEMLEKAPESAVDAAAERISDVYDLTGFLEDLPSFIEKLRIMAGLHGAFPNDRLNETGRDDSAVLFTESIRSRIAEHNLLDVMLFERLREKHGKLHVPV